MDDSSVKIRGFKSVNWKRDPVILARLEVVSQFLLQGAKLWQIAENTGMSIATSQTDCKRVRELWFKDASDAVELNRDRSIAQIRYVQQRAWQDVNSLKGIDHTHARIKAMRVVIECEKEVMDLQGTRTANKVELTGADGGALKVDGFKAALDRVYNPSAKPKVDEDADEGEEA